VEQREESRAEQQAGQRAGQTAERTTEQGSSRDQCGSGKYSQDKSDRDKIRGRSAEISDSGDEIRIEHAPAERQGSTEGADAGADTGRKNMRTKTHEEKEWETRRKKSTQSAGSGDTALNRGKQDHAQVKGGAEGTGSTVTWIYEWIPMLQKYGEYVLGWTGLGCLYTMIILGVKYIFVIPIHAKAEARKDIATMIAGSLSIGIAILVVTAMITVGLYPSKATAGLDTHASAINVAMHMDAQEKILPVVTKRKFESRENVNVYMGNGNSGELKEDGQQRTSGRNNELDGIDHTKLTRKDTGVHKQEQMEALNEENMRYGKNQRESANGVRSSEESQETSHRKYAPAVKQLVHTIASLIIALGILSMNVVVLLGWIRDPFFAAQVSTSCK